MMETVTLLVFGLLFLIFGGELLVRGASKLALILDISPLVIGVTIVAFGTSAPELLISLTSALSGSSDLAMGNVIGSNICNLSLVLGFTALMAPVSVNPNSIRIDWPVTMAASVLLYILAQSGTIELWNGLLFIAILLMYLIFLIRSSRKETKSMQGDKDLVVEEGQKVSIWKHVALIIVGGLGLYFGSEWFVGGAKILAESLGVSERVIGLSVLALGTSLPELVTAIVASYKKETDIAIGNLLGSNVFNILMILGITSIITPVNVSQLLIDFDMLWMLGITALIWPFMVTEKTLARWEGAVLLLIYLVYAYVAFINPEALNIFS